MRLFFPFSEFLVAVCQGKARIRRITAQNRRSVQCFDRRGLQFDWGVDCGLDADCRGFLDTDFADYADFLTRIPGQKTTKIRPNLCPGVLPKDV